MLTPAESEVLSRVGPGTPAGTLLRRYWHPVAAVEQMADRWTKRVRILGEDLVLFRDRSGTLGLIGEFCPHRRASLAYGIPTEDGIRCPYHGWKFDAAGRCLEQPNEPAGSALRQARGRLFRDKVTTAGYPVAELGGLIWGYLGPLPAPLVPRLDGYVVEPAIRSVGITRVQCNWLQIMENSVDPVHTEWLHGKLYEFVREKDGVKVPIGRHHLKIGFDETELGITKRRLMEGQSEDCSDWTTGHPVVFPTTLAFGNGGDGWTYYGFQIRVPIDDVTTEHYWYSAFAFPEGTEIPAHLLGRCPAEDAPARGADGEYLLDVTFAQDVMAWETQGQNARRDLEHLGTTDRGVIMFRQMLAREIEKVQAGRDPIVVLRDPAKNEIIELPVEMGKDMNTDGFEQLVSRSMVGCADVAKEIVDVYRRVARPSTSLRYARDDGECVRGTS